MLLFFSTLLSSHKCSLKCIQIDVWESLNRTVGVRKACAEEGAKKNKLIFDVCVLLNPPQETFMRLQDRWLPGGYKRSKMGPSTFSPLIPDPLDGSPVCLSLCTPRTVCLRSLAPTPFSTLPGSILHNIMITVWGKCLLGMKKRTCGWKMMFPHNYARTVWDSHPLHPPPLCLLAIGRKRKEKESCCCLQLQSCGRSQKGVPSITAVSCDRWPGYQRAGINDALSVHTAGSSCFFFFVFFSHGHALQSCFSLLSRGGAISCSIILQADRWRKR